MDVGSSTRATRTVRPVGLAGAFMFTASACVATAHAANPRAAAPWTVHVPAVQAPSLHQIRQILGSVPGAGPNLLPLGKLSAASFTRGDSQVRTSSRQWISLERQLCGTEGSLAEALSLGWHITVTGYIDSTGLMGPGTLNSRLPIERAQAAARALEDACRVPTGRITTAGGGVDGPGASARKVTVDYTRGTAGEAK
jgi:outer membrane protein OmpA-like peptidoglycan-associated protein